MIKKLLSTLLLTGTLLSVHSTPVDLNTAASVGGNFMKQRMQQFTTSTQVNTDIAEIIPLSSTPSLAFAINFKNGGFVLISGDNAAKPVLGYSYEGSFNTTNIPDEVQAWMQVYYNKIQDIRENIIEATPEIQQEWDNLIIGTSGERENREVTPLLYTTWDQGARYNNLCPADPLGPGGHVWSGCVATAMSQIINYWRYPLQGTGSHGYYSDYGYLSVNFGASTYDYNQMNYNINAEQNYEMAEIQYHCGVAVDMMYSPNGSGAYSDDAANALKNYFGYSQNLSLEYKDDYSEAEWANLLMSNLDNGWPMYYHGFGSGGHAFNVDGYQGTDYFHFNWGWSGSYNGYFYLSNLNPGGNDFTWGQGAIVNFYPSETNYPYYCSGVTTLTRHSGTIQDGSGPTNNYVSGLSCGWLIDPADSVYNLTLSFDKFDLANGDVVNVFDGENSSAPLIGSYTLTSAPTDIPSTSGKFYLEFLTNSNQGSGFRAHYQSYLVNYCSGITNLIEPTGTFTDGSGPRDYRNNSICKYLIKPDSAATITISFDEFSTEANHDKVKIYDMISQQLIAELSGDTLPDDVFVPSGKAYILFLTNDSVSSTGWQITYTSTVTAIDAVSPAQKIKLYCSPNPADDWLRIDIRTHLKENISIDIISADGKAENLYTGLTNGESTVVLSDISKFSPGLYLLRYKTESEAGSLKVLIK